MVTVLLVIIYIAFISLGLPDTIMGSAWPMIYQDLQVPISYAGVFTMIVSGGTILSSFFSEKLIRFFGTGKITAISVAMTAVSLLGICFAPNYVWICLLGIPMGLGAGSVDSALNNFVALHYEARHMNWLHGFWGIGATTGPMIMSLFLTRENGWRKGYGTIGIMQILLVICLILSLPLWKKMSTSQEKEKEVEADTKISTLLKLKGATPSLLSFLCYCAVESTTGLWGSTYLVMYKHVSAETAARWIATFYLGITIGRFLTGFISMYLDNKKMIRMGQLMIAAGVIMMIIPFSIYFQMIGLILIGLGCAPIYPAMLHETPIRFGAERSQGIMGIQMAVAYVGSTFMPPFFGFIATKTGFSILPLFLIIFTILMFITSEIVGKKCYH
ncbi:MAG: MFS transporter [Lachnospiraceae bacterium]|nr:MFS transporter [Lachnospiraceae bacterium]